MSSKAAKLYVSVAGRLLPAGHTCGEFPPLVPSSLARADRVPGDRKRTWQDCDRHRAVSPRLRFCAQKRVFSPRGSAGRGTGGKYR